MNLSSAKSEIFKSLQDEILALQGYKKIPGQQQLKSGLGPIEQAFPGNVFPRGAIHEFVSADAERAAATSGFISGLLSALTKEKRSCIWISTQRNIFPPALKSFGLEPDNIVFIDVKKQKEALWVMEEALKCEALTVVVGEVNQLSFTESRRLQLAVEQSRVTGLLHRSYASNNIACISRWQIASLPSSLETGMPGVGHPQWEVTLQKVRNGKPGKWQVAWSENGFQVPCSYSSPVVTIPVRKAG